MAAALTDIEVYRLFVERRRRVLRVFFWGLGAGVLSATCYVTGIATGQPTLILLSITPYAPWLVWAIVQVRRIWRCPSCSRRFPATTVGGGLRYWKEHPSCQYCGRKLLP